MIEGGLFLVSVLFSVAIAYESIKVHNLSATVKQLEAKKQEIINKKGR